LLFFFCCLSFLSGSLSSLSLYWFRSRICLSFSFRSGLFFSFCLCVVFLSFCFLVPPCVCFVSPAVSLYYAFVPFFSFFFVWCVWCVEPVLWWEGKLESPKLEFWRKASNLSGLFSRFFLFLSSLGFSPVFPPVSPLCHGLSLAFIKPENAMRSCLCHGRHRGAACRRLLICCHFSFHLNRCEWKRWWI
jgi:hypothetical protein